MDEVENFFDSINVAEKDFGVFVDSKWQTMIQLLNKNNYQ